MGDFEAEEAALVGSLEVLRNLKLVELRNPIEVEVVVVVVREGLDCRTRS
jgi:hypothetical protein